MELDIDELLKNQKGKDDEPVNLDNFNKLVLPKIRELIEEINGISSSSMEFFNYLVYAMELMIEPAPKDEQLLLVGLLLQQTAVANKMEEKRKAKEDLKK